MKIRKFKLDDAKELNVIISDCLLNVNSKDYSKKVISNMLSHYSISKIITSSKEKNIYVLEDLNKIIGTICISENQIYSLYVSPFSFKKGLGSKLVFFAEEEIKKNFSSVIIYSSLTAINFYSKLGYKKIKNHNSDFFGSSIKMEKLF